MSTNNNNNINVTVPPQMQPHYGLLRKNAWATFWLCGFFGFLGVHRFYLGHTGLGILYLFTVGLAGVGAIVDLFLSWHITKNENERRGYGRVTK